ncbi:MAG: Rrf2 family transcriptional regulator [Rhodospirillales bacterium]|nr:Rrf2 family transcriptional regulator [Rhodospirillales bacterium]
MLRLTKKLLFGIEAVLDIAYNAGGKPVQAAAVTKRQGIPARYLEQVLQALVREGILAGQRGPGGGYRLARERRRISVGDIVRVIRKIETAPDPITHSPGSPLGHHVLRPLWLELQGEFMTRLDAITIEDLCHRAKRAELKPDIAASIDFTI